MMRYRAVPIRVMSRIAQMYPVTNVLRVVLNAKRRSLFIPYYIGVPLYISAIIAALISSIRSLMLAG